MTDHNWSDCTWTPQHRDLMAFDGDDLDEARTEVMRSLTDLERQHLHAYHCEGERTEAIAATCLTVGERLNTQYAFTARINNDFGGADKANLAYQRVKDLIHRQLGPVHVVPRVDGPMKLPGSLANQVRIVRCERCTQDCWLMPLVQPEDGTRRLCNVCVVALLAETPSTLDHTWAECDRFAAPPKLLGLDTTKLAMAVVDIRSLMSDRDKRLNHLANCCNVDDAETRAFVETTARRIETYLRLLDDLNFADPDTVKIIDDDPRMWAMALRRRHGLVIPCIPATWPIPDLAPDDLGTINCNRCATTCHYYKELTVDDRYEMVCMDCLQAAEQILQRETGHKKRMVCIAGPHVIHFGDIWQGEPICDQLAFDILIDGKVEVPLCPKHLESLRDHPRFHIQFRERRLL